MKQLNHKYEIENKHLEKLVLYGFRIAIERKGNPDDFITATAVKKDSKGNKVCFSANGLSVSEATKNLHSAVLLESCYEGKESKCKQTRINEKQECKVTGNFMEESINIKPDKKQVAMRLKKIRSNLHLTIADFGNYLGVPKGTANSWLRGLAFPPENKLKRIAFMADTTSEWILWGDELPSISNNLFRKNYFISYRFIDSNGNYGFGNKEMAVDLGISDINDIKKIEEQLKNEGNFSDLVVLHYTLF